ncbi:MAG: xanthine dehydrogenase family protein subunit M [Solirubrobacteraceae bacterium]
MKPPPFTYVAPANLAEAIAVLAEHGGDAKVLAGGQSLVPLMNLRMARPSALVDVCRLPELAAVSLNGAIAIGATTRQRVVRDSPIVSRAWPVLVDALSHVGHPATRARGTIGGSIAHADPAAEIPALLVALGGEIAAHGPGGERVIAADDLFISHFTTALAEDEILTQVRLPLPAPGTVAAFSEVVRRRGDFALVGVVAVARLDAAGHVQSPRIVLFGIDEVPLRATGAEQLITGHELDVELIAAAARQAAEEIDPTADVQGSAEYRRELAEARVAHVLRELTPQEGVAT